MAIDIPDITSEASRNGSEQTTAKWLVLPGPDGQRWRLPDDTSLQFVEAHVKWVMKHADAFVFELHAEDGKLGRRVVLNGRALPFVELYETND